MAFNKSFIKTFYQILSEEDLPVSVSQTPSALPADIENKDLEIKLLNLCKKCLYVDVESLPESRKIDLIQLKARIVSYSNVNLILQILEATISKIVPNYRSVFTSEYLQEINKYNSQETLIDLVKLAKKCLFTNSKPENSDDNEKEFSPFLANKIQEITPDNIEEVKKAMLEICSSETFA